jgi:integrase
MIRKIAGNGKPRWEVRLREGGRGSKSVRRRFLRKEDAERFEIELRRTKQLGGSFAPFTTTQTLDEFAAQWWSRAEPRLALTTKASYIGSLQRYILPRLGATRLSALTPLMVNRFKHELLTEGRGLATVRYAGQVLSAICADAVVNGFLQANPCHAVKWPGQTRQRAIRPLSPLDIEKLRHQMPTEQDAVLVSLLGYAGLRPQEALALTWADVQKNVLIVDKAVTYGVTKSTKNSRHRWVQLLRPLADDLSALRKSLPAIPGPGAFVFPHPLDASRPWGDASYRNWSRRTFNPAARRAKVTATPYTLRHSFVSLLLAAGRRPAEVAEQAGHTVAVMESTYAHVIEEFRGMQIADPAKQIREARVSLVRHRQTAGSQGAVEKRLG